jgi:hypothetical protein
VINIGFAADTVLPVVSLGAKLIGPVNLGDVSGFEIGFEERAQIADLKSRR